MVDTLRTATPGQLPPWRRACFEEAAARGETFAPEAAARRIAWLASDLSEANGAVLDAWDDRSRVERAELALQG